MSNWFTWNTSPRSTGTTPSAGSTKPPPSPVISYTPGGQAKQPGFNNPSNPYDTGRSGEKNSENVAAGQGGKAAWWDYDLGRPKSGVQLNTEGFYYGSGGGGGGGGSAASAFMGDPILAQAQALASRQREIARSGALAKRKQAAVEYGDASGLQGFDEATIAAARDNPFSVLANMKRGYESGVESLEGDLNASNLFYSGYRGKELGRAATGYQGQRSSASGAFQGFMTDIENALAQALLNADWQEASALEGAYMRALSQAMEYGYDYPGDGGDDGSGPHPQDEITDWINAALSGKKKTTAAARPPVYPGSYRAGQGWRPLRESGGAALSKPPPRYPPFQGGR